MESKHKERRFWNEEIQSLSSGQLRELQFKKLKKQLKYCYDNSAFYRQRFKEAGAEVEDIKSWADFRRLPPMLDKNVDRASQEESLRKEGHPFGLNLCAPLEKVVGVNATSGTSGNPTFYAFTAKDIEVQNEAFARGYWLTGIRPGDTVIHAAGLSMWLGGTSVLRGLQGMGARAIPVGAEAGTDRVLQFAELTKPTAMVCTPSMAIQLAEKAQKRGKNVADLGIRRIVVFGEPGAGLPEVRKRIESAYGATLHDGASGIWGLHSVACDAEEYEGLHMVCEDFLIIWDIIDPQTKEPLEITNGAMGEWCMTALEWEAAPPIRYAVGDLIQVFLEPCPHCGFHWTRLKIHGRTDDMIIVKGVNLYPSAVKNLVNSFHPRITGEFRILLKEPPPRVTPPLEIKVEYGQGMEGESLDLLKREIQDKMVAQLRVRPEVILVPPDSLPRDPAKKAQFFEKLY